MTAPTERHMAEQQQSFTPGPWRHNPVYRDGELLRDEILSAGGVIADDIREPDDAAFIVRACNSHDALVEALEAINRITSPGNRTFDEMIRDMGYACDTSRAALASAQASS